MADFQRYCKSAILALKGYDQPPKREVGSPCNRPWLAAGPVIGQPACFAEGQPAVADGLFAGT